jgi:hypothetical protein
MWLFCAHIAVAATDTMSTSDDALIGAVAATVARDDAVIDALFRGSGRNRSPCQHVYLDVGSNIGVQLRKLYEPRLYPHAQVLPIFDRLFGTDSGSRCGVCALGFEPNPHHAARLARLQVHLTHRLGVRAHVFRAAAGTADSVATFAMPSKHGASGKTDGSADWAASTNAPYRGMDRRAGYLKYQSTTSVRVLDLSRIIRRVARLLRPTSSTSSTQQHPGSGSRSPHPQDQVAQAATRPKLFMKLDCEGCEMELLHHLVFTQALCSIDEMYIEWHDSSLRRSTSGSTPRSRALAQTPPAGPKCGGCCAQSTHLSSMASRRMQRATQAHCRAAALSEAATVAWFPPPLI